MNASLPVKTRPRDFWQTLDTVLMCALIVAMCSQINLRAIGRDTLSSEGFVTKQLFLALSDVVFLGVFAWFCARTTALRAWRKLWIPPLPCWILIFAMLLSALHSARVVDATAETLSQSHGIVGALKALKDTKEFKEAAAEIIQFAATFLLAPLLFVNLLRDLRTLDASTREYSQDSFVDRTRAALLAFCITAAFVFIFAKSSSKDLPRSVWGSPNMFGVFAAVAGAFLFSLSMWQTRSNLTVPVGKKRLILSDGQIFFLLGFIVLSWNLQYVTSVWPLLALALGAIAGMIALRAGKIGLIAVFLVFFSTPWGWNNNVPVRDALAASWRVSTPTQRVKKQYVEWYAAMGWSRPARNRFATGVGAGNYQFNVGSYYGGLPNEAKMPPDSNNLYLVQMVSLGALGLGALLWVLAHFLKIAWRAARWKSTASTRESGAALGAASFSALFAFAVVNVFHAGIVRGMSLVLAFLLSLAIVAWQQSESAADNEIIEEIINEE